jgi:predicted choloylglycine hydrolase
MNECGLAVSILSVPDRGGTEKVPGKITITGTSTMRLILDHAKNLDEAIGLMKKYNLRFGGSHYLIADAEGNSAIVEVIGGELKIIKNIPVPWPNQKYPWQVISNFLVTNGVGGGHDRYSTATQELLKKEGVLTEMEAMNLLRSVAQHPKDTPSVKTRTIWSAVYNLNTRELNLVLDRQYEQVMKFKLKGLGLNK